MTVDVEVLAKLLAQEIAKKAPQASERTFEEVSALIEERLLGRWTKSAGYLANVRNGLAKARQAIGHKRICDLTPEDAMEVWLRLPPRSLHSQGGGLKSILKAAELQLGIAGLKAFVAFMPAAKQSRERHIVITDETQREVFKALRWARRKELASPQMLDLLEVEWLSPFRAGELAALRVEDVDLRERLATVPISKNGKPRRVPLPVRAVEILAAQVERLPVPANRRAPRWVWPNDRSKLGHERPDAAGKAWAAIRDAYCDARPSPASAAIRDYWLHSARAVISTQGQAHGAAPRSMMSALGHTSPKTIERYTFAQTASAVDGVDRATDPVTRRPRKRRALRPQGALAELLGR